MRSMVAALALLLSVPLAARDRVSRAVPVDAAAWLRQYAVAPTTGVTALVPRHARVIALGDGTHGTHEFLEFKRNLVPALIDSHGVAAIAFEAPYGEWTAIDRYVQTGEGDLSELLRSVDFFFWDTQEVFDLLTEIRARNAAGASIRIAGVDAWHPHSAIDRVYALLGSAGGELKSTVERRYECFEYYRDMPGSYDVAAREACRAPLWSVRPLLVERRAALEPLLGAAAYDELLHAARLVEQGEEARGTNGANRDAAHAENIAWLADRAQGTPVVVWGHNEHLGKLPYKLGHLPQQKSAGAILTEWFGSGYFSIATTASGGMFHAGAPGPSYGAIGAYALGTAAADDVAARIAIDPRPALAVPFGAPPPSLSGELSMRAGGSNIASPENATVNVRGDLAKKYDVIVWWRVTTPSHLRHWPLLR